MSEPSKTVKPITLTFLGSGTSTGVPAICCQCHTCRSTDRRDKRLRASALVTIGDTNLLIDCGPDFRQQILLLDSPQLRALLITHHHYDHVGGLDDLRPYCYPDGFDIYCNQLTNKNIRHNLPYCFVKEHYPGTPVFHTHIIEPYKPFYIDGIEIIPLAVNHYLMEIVGFRIGQLAYITDAKVVPDKTIDEIRHIDTLVINALRYKEHISHMNLSQALSVIDRVRPRVAYLTHISHDLGCHADVEPTLPSGVHLAYDGLRIEVNA